jgi:Sulfotransferase family
MPIILGVPRSGTTLLRLMLDAHSDLAVTHEAGFVPLVANLSNPLSRMFYRWQVRRIKQASWGGLRDEVYRIITELSNWNDFHLSREDFKQALGEIEPFDVATALRTFFRCYANRFNKSRWGDKTPLYNLHLKIVGKVLPEAHFIHIIRDGRDAAVSGKGLPFGGGDVVTIARLWSSQIQETRRQAHKCRHYLEVRYEDLILKTSEVLQRICEFIDLPYESSMQQYYLRAPERMSELENVYHNDGKLVSAKEDRLQRHRLTAQPPEPSRIGRWKTAMTREELALFNNVAGKTLKELGYE